VWLLFHRNAKTKVVKDGESFVETCPECGRRARFDEVELSESFGVFFVDLITEKERKFRCSVCGDVFDLRDQPEPAPAATPARSARDIERDRVAAQARRRAEHEQRERIAEQVRLRADQQRHREAIADQARLRADQQRHRELEEARANRIEDELAELKKRLGRY
jgi:rubredoxin